MQPPLNVDADEGFVEVRRMGIEVTPQGFGDEGVEVRMPTIRDKRAGFGQQLVRQLNLDSFNRWRHIRINSSPGISGSGSSALRPFQRSADLIYSPPEAQDAFEAGEAELGLLFRAAAEHGSDDAVTGAEDVAGHESVHLCPGSGCVVETGRAATFAIAGSQAIRVRSSDRPPACSNQPYRFPGSRAGNGRRAGCG